VQPVICLHLGTQDRHCVDPGQLLAKFQGLTVVLRDQSSLFYAKAIEMIQDLLAVIPSN
jgi:hypothetical protein